MTRLAIVVAAMLLFVGAARAQQLDLADITCKEFQADDKDKVAVLSWLQAYYTEPNAKPVVDFDKMRADGGKIGEYCSKNPGHSVITAADEVLGK